MNQLKQQQKQSQKTQEIHVSKPLNEALELAKELNLTKQVKILEFEEWRKGVEYKEVLPQQVLKELMELAFKIKIKDDIPRGSGYRHNGTYYYLDQTKVEEFNEKMPFAALIRMKEAKERGFDHYEIWGIREQVDPVLVGVKYEGEEEVKADGVIGSETPFITQGSTTWVGTTTDSGTAWTAQEAVQREAYQQMVQQAQSAPIDHNGNKWYDGGSPVKTKKVMRKVRPHYFELCRWV